MMDDWWWIGCCVHVRAKWEVVDTYPEEPAGRIPRLWSQAKANILVELLIIGARYMISSPMSDNIVV